MMQNMSRQKDAAKRGASAGGRSPIMKKEQFIILAQKQASELAVGASSLRNQGDSGLIDIARAFFKDITLSDYLVATQPEFASMLDEATRALQKKFPDKAQNWGAARKALNLFLRDAFYNRYLYEHYKLGPLEYWLEVPLDKDVATNLLETTYGRTLPKWKSIKALKPEESDKYQDAASKYSRDQGIARVHLDLLFWRKEKK